MSETTLSPEQREAIAPILGKTPSGVFILTVADGAGRETGMLASWVQQASFDPPIVSVAVNAKRYVNDWLRQHPVAAVSIVGKSGSGAVFKHFGKGFESDEPAFEGVETSRGSTGLPLLSGAIGAIEGRIVGEVEAGDHVVYLLRIEDARAGTAIDEDPYVHLRKNGFNY
jgi:flavin reductase (DIM6/NTAB) family NADH-FMN oxidoreductase RutF